MITPKPGQLIRFKPKSGYRGDIYLVVERCFPPTKYCWANELCWKVIVPAGTYDYVHDSYLNLMEVVKT